MDEQEFIERSKTFTPIIFLDYIDLVYQLRNEYRNFVQSKFFSKFASQKTKFYKKYFKGASLPEAYLKGADLSNADLSDVYSNKANLTKANLTNVNFTRAELRLVTFIYCNLINTNFTGADLSFTKFKLCDMATANFTKADLYKTELNNCLIRKSQLSIKQMKDVLIRSENIIWVKERFEELQDFNDKIKYEKR